MNLQNNLKVQTAFGWNLTAISYIILQGIEGRFAGKYGLKTYAFTHKYTSIEPRFQFHIASLHLIGVYFLPNNNHKGMDLNILDLKI